MKKPTIWNGTDEELLTLAEVLRRHCACAGAVNDGPRCSAHDMLLSQRTLDGLLFARRIAQQLIVREILAEPAVMFTG